MKNLIKIVSILLIGAFMASCVAPPRHPHGMPPGQAKKIFKHKKHHPHDRGHHKGHHKGPRGRH